MTSPDEYRAVAQVIHEQTGLIFPAVREEEVRRALERALPRDHDPHRLRRLLATDGDVRETLIAELTVGETYFLRDADQFALLRRLLPELAAARGGVPVRVWSAGCASGEETYSVAIVAEELGLGDRVSVLGTDLSRTRLAQARRGVYRQWSLRGVAPDVIDRFFDRRGELFHIRPHLRDRVELRYLNLAEDRFPSLTAGVWGMDVVLCRNVLIYFDRPTVERVAVRLANTLNDDGWLLLGAADPAIGGFADVETVLTPGGIAYRRGGRATGPPAGAESAGAGDPPSDAAADVRPFEPGAAAAVRPSANGAGPPQPTARSHPEPAVPPSQPVVPAPPAATDPTAAASDDPLAALRRAYVARNYDHAESLARDAIARGVAGPEPWIVLIRSLANRGCLPEAGRAAAEALERHRDSAELLYLHGVLLAQSGLHADAAAAARRALYLDRDLVVAHMALADARARLGDRDAARRALRNADALLAGMDVHATVPASDGQPVARLRQIVRMQLSLIASAA